MQANKNSQGNYQRTVLFETKQRRSPVDMHSFQRQLLQIILNRTKQPNKSTQIGQYLQFQYIVSRLHRIEREQYSVFVSLLGQFGLCLRRELFEMHTYACKCARRCRNVCTRTRDESSESFMSTFFSTELEAS